MAKTSAMLLTTTIRGERVLGKIYGDGDIVAVTYANRTQAFKRQATLRTAGIESDVISFGRPWYLRITLVPETVSHTFPKTI